MNSGSSLLSLAKKVIRTAATVGLDEAGTRICGPTAWEYVKRALSPVIEELEHRFPKLFLVEEEAVKASEALSEDRALQRMLSDGFAGLQDGQQEILAALARQDATLTEIGSAVTDSFKKAGEQTSAAFDNLGVELRRMTFEIEALKGLMSAPPTDQPRLPALSLPALCDQAHACQADAMKWIEAGDSVTAGRRLDEGRSLLETGLRRDPVNADLLLAFGYIEKTQAQVAQLQGDSDRYVTSLAEAAKYFAEVLRKQPRNVGALNGMANIYLFNKDYDHAIRFGTLAVGSAPDYGAAYWDLAIALEGKLAEGEGDSSLIDQLRSVYRHLLSLMPQQPYAFTASDLAHVQQRLTQLTAQ